VFGETSAICTTNEMGMGRSCWEGREPRAKRGEMVHNTVEEGWMGCRGEIGNGG
jgi:hypothetical protein